MLQVLLPSFVRGGGEAWVISWLAQGHARWVSVRPETDTQVSLRLEQSFLLRPAASALTHGAGLV